MKTEEIRALLKRFKLEANVAGETDGAILLKMQKDNIQIEVTIPSNCLEIFYDATDLKSGRKIEDWHDCYGDTAETDHRDRLELICDVLANKTIRLSQDFRTVEFEDASWQYLFGRFREEEMR